MEGDATNQETRLSNRSASAAISFERSRIFAVISATVLRSAKILAASRACDAPGVADVNFFAAGLATLPFAGLWRMASIRFILSAPILPGKRAQNPYGLEPRIVRGRLDFTGIAFADSHETLDFAGSRPPALLHLLDSTGRTGLYRGAIRRAV